MTDKTENTESKKQESADQEMHLPDVISAENDEEIVDLPRPGIPKDVLGLTKADFRFPDVLIGD